MYNSYYYGSNMAGLSIFIVILFYIWALLALIAWCKLFSKAGLPWERMFVPVYGSYWQYKIADATGIFWANLGMGVLLTIVMLVSPNMLARSRYSSSGLGGLGILLIIVGIALFVLQCIYMVKLAKAYGKGGGFAVGLILLYPIFILILGFGDSEYVGPNGGNYGVNAINVPPSWTCPSCGTVNAASRGSCERCGQKK